MKSVNVVRLLTVLMEIAVAAEGNVDQPVATLTVAGVEKVETASELARLNRVLEAVGALWSMGLIRLSDNETILLTSQGLKWAYASSAKAKEVSRRSPELWLRMMAAQAAVATR
jgi:hypothetical protein